MEPFLQICGLNNCGFELHGGASPGSTSLLWRFPPSRDTESQPKAPNGCLWGWTVGQPPPTLISTLTLLLMPQIIQHVITARMFGNKLSLYVTIIIKKKTSWMTPEILSGRLDQPAGPCQSSCVHGHYGDYNMEQLPSMLSNEFQRG